MELLGVHSNICRWDINQGIKALCIDKDYSHALCFIGMKHFIITIIGKKTLAPWKKSYVQPKQHIKRQRYHFANKGLSSQSYGFSSSHVWMWELDHKESWVWKNWCFWTVVLEKTLESPLDGTEIKPVNPKGTHSWIVIGRTDAEAEAPILWPPDVKNWLMEKTLMLGKTEGGRRRGCQRMRQLDGNTN